MVQVLMKVYFKGNGKARSFDWVEKELVGTVPQEDGTTVKKNLTVEEYKWALHAKFKHTKENKLCYTFNGEDGEIIIIDFSEVREISILVTEIKEEQH